MCADLFKTKVTISWCILLSWNNITSVWYEILLRTFILYKTYYFFFFLRSQNYIPHQMWRLLGHCDSDTFEILHRSHMMTTLIPLPFWRFRKLFRIFPFCGRKAFRSQIFIFGETNLLTSLSSLIVLQRDYLSMHCESWDSQLCLELPIWNVTADIWCRYSKKHSSGFLALFVNLCSWEVLLYFFLYVVSQHGQPSHFYGAVIDLNDSKQSNHLLKRTCATKLPALSFSVPRLVCLQSSIRGNILVLNIKKHLKPWYERTI